MIDYLVVIYKNYDLLDLQVQNFRKRFDKSQYRLIVVDNTPNGEKQKIEENDIIDKIVLVDSNPTFDGISHGNAINKGLEYITSDIVGLIDSDYFILNDYIHTYVEEKFKQGYVAVGTEYNDGKDTKQWVAKNPAAFENIPVCFNAYYSTEIAKSHSWIITQSDVDANRGQGYVEVGWRIRKHIFETGLKAHNWKTDATEYGTCFFRDENNTVMGAHYVAGSHRRWNAELRKEIENMIDTDYSSYKKLTHCLCCGSDELEEILNLNNQPLANSYLDTQEDVEDTYPLGINFCTKCTHTQLTVAVDPDKLFRNYLYVSGTTNTLREYFDCFVDLTAKYTDGKKVLDIACNDGTQLDYYKAKGYDTYGVDPATNLHEISSKKHNVVLDYFPSPLLTDNKFDIITAQNVFAHNTYPLDFLKECKNLLSEKGVIFIQTSQADMIKNNEFDTIYHEHISFFSVKSFCTLASRAGLNVIDVIRTPVHGTSFVFVVSATQPDRSKELIAAEIELTYFKMLQYAKRCKEVVAYTNTKIDQIRAKGYKVVGYGAAAKGNTFQNFAKFKLDYIIDENPLKQGKYVPGARTPIVSLDALKNETDKLCVVPLAWNFFDEIKSKVIAIRPDATFLKYFPEVLFIN